MLTCKSLLSLYSLDISMVQMECMVSPAVVSHGALSIAVVRVILVERTISQFESKLKSDLSSLENEHDNHITYP